MEMINKQADITIAKVSVYENGCIRFSVGAVSALHLADGDLVSFYRNDSADEWCLKRFGGNVELRRERNRKGLMGYHSRFARAFLASLGDGFSRVTCRVATTPNDEGMYALLTNSII